MGIVVEWIETERGTSLTQENIWENARLKVRESNLFSNYMKPKSTS